MPKWKKAAVSAVAVILVCGHFLDLLTGREHWPFSSYPMYGRLLGESLTSLRLFGVTRSLPEKEISLDRAEYLLPLSTKKVNKTVERLSRNPERIDEALREILVRYDSRHAGPPLRAVRLYRLTWPIDPLARNRETPKRTLLREAGAE